MAVEQVGVEMGWQGKGKFNVMLAGELAGYWIGIDTARLTMGVLEDLYGADPTQLLDSIASCLCDGSLPGGIDREGLRALTRPQFAEISNAIAEAYRVPPEPDSRPKKPTNAPKLTHHILTSTIAGVLSTLNVFSPVTRAKPVYVEIEIDEEPRRFELGWIGGYRGVYEGACLYPRTPARVKATEVASLDNLMARIEESIGKTLYRYEGGEFTVDQHRPFWFAETENEYPGYYFSSVRIESSRVVLCCKEQT